MNIGHTKVDHKDKCLVAPIQRKSSRQNGALSGKKLPALKKRNKDLVHRGGNAASIK